MTGYTADDYEGILHETYQVLIVSSDMQQDRSVEEYVTYLESYIQHLRSIEGKSYALNALYNHEEMSAPGVLINTLKAPLDEMPLRINSTDIRERAIVLWRLKNAR